MAFAGCSDESHQGSSRNKTNPESSTTDATIGASNDPTATATTTAAQANAAAELRTALDEADLQDPLAEHCVTARAAEIADIPTRVAEPGFVPELLDDCEAHAELSRQYAAASGAASQSQADCLATGFAALPAAIVADLLTAFAQAPPPDSAAGAALTDLVKSCE